jgi:hypothetical protein
LVVRIIKKEEKLLSFVYIFGWVAQQCSYPPDEAMFIHLACP